MKRHVYGSADIYAPLVEPGSTDVDLVHLVIDQASPVVPVGILRHEERMKRAEHILAIRKRLKEAYQAVLERFGLRKLSQRLVGREALMEIEDICDEIRNKAERNSVRQALRAERDFATAEFLHGLGFSSQDLLTPQLLSSQREREGDVGRQQPLFERSSSSKKTDVPFLADALPEWFPRQAVSRPYDVMPRELDRVAEFPPLARLASWIHETGTQFSGDVHTASSGLSALMAKIVPSGPTSQPFEGVSDLPPTFASLLEVILNKKNSIRARFEALRLLEWSIGVFSVSRNPIYQAQQMVREQLLAKLKKVVWAPGGEKQFRDIPVDERILQLVQSEELPAGDRLRKILELARAIAQERGVETDLELGADQADDAVTFIGRRVNSDIADILKRHSDTGAVKPGSTDRLIFKSREKDVFATVLKIFIYKELHDRCEATLKDQKTGMSKTDAKEKMKEIKRAMSRRHREDDLAVKPVGFDALDDFVGFSFAVDLQKPLDDYVAAERGEVNKMFSELGTHIVQKLGLKGVRRGNHLWKPNGRNVKSAKGFRVYKLHGFYPLEQKIFRDGNPVIETIDVPVEIQLYPVETRLRMFYPGAVGEAGYGRRKGEMIEDRLKPAEIAGRTIYPLTHAGAQFEAYVNDTVGETA